ARRGRPPASAERAAASDESGENIGPELKSLIEEGKERGYVTYDELNKVLPDDLVSPEKLDAVLRKMEDLGIEMVEASEEEADDGEAEEEKEEPREREPKPTSGSTVPIDDPVRLYLTQMGGIPLLT